MAVVETLAPSSDVSDGAWQDQGGGTTLANDIDEVGSHDGDTSYVWLRQSGAAGSTSSEFEVHLDNPTVWAANNPQVRDAESWKELVSLRVRDGESWKHVKALSVRDGGAWKVVVPQVVVKVTAKAILSSGFASASATAKLKLGAVQLASAGLTLNSGYEETSFSVNASPDLLGIDPSDLRVAISGTCITDQDFESAEIRVTQAKVELND